MPRQAFILGQTLPASAAKRMSFSRHASRPCDDWHINSNQDFSNSQLCTVMIECALQRLETRERAPHLGWLRQAVRLWAGSTALKRAGKWPVGYDLRDAELCGSRSFGQARLCWRPCGHLVIRCVPGCSRCLTRCAIRQAICDAHPSALVY